MPPTNQIRSGRRRLFLKEHRQAKGVSADAMAGRLGIERESVYRLEREPRRVNSEKQAEWAAALDVEPEQLWRPPGAPSVDALLRDAAPDVQEMVADIARRLVVGKGIERTCKSVGEIVAPEARP